MCWVCFGLVGRGAREQRFDGWWLWWWLVGGLEWSRNSKYRVLYGGSTSTSTSTRRRSDERGRRLDGSDRPSDDYQSYRMYPVIYKQ